MKDQTQQDFENDFLTPRWMTWIIQLNIEFKCRLVRIIKNVSDVLGISCKSIVLVGSLKEV